VFCLIKKKLDFFGGGRRGVGSIIIGRACGMDGKDESIITCWTMVDNNLMDWGDHCAF
jgi:hypothetical protein